MASPDPGPKPWKPYPRQMEALRALADGSSLSEAGQKMGGITAQAVSSLLSHAYSRLRVKDIPHPHHSTVRRDWAIRVCREHGWWED